MTKEKQKAFYDGYYSNLKRYEKRLNNNVITHFERRLMKFFLEIVLEQKSEKVKILEVGGAGRNFVVLNDLIENMEEKECNLYEIEIDISKGGLNITKKLLEKCRCDTDFIVANALDLPFKNNEMDIVFCRDLLHHVDNISQCVSEMHRVCKHGGKIIAIETNILNPQVMLIATLFFPVEKGYLKTNRWKYCKTFKENSLANISVNLTDFFPSIVLIRWPSNLPFFFNLYQKVPNNLLRFVDIVDNFLKKIPVIKEFATYIIIVADKP